MDFCEYVKILKKAFNKSISQEDLCNLLFNAVAIPLDLKSDSGDMYIIDKAEVSYIMNRKKAVPIKIRDNVFEEKVLGTIDSYFKKSVIPYLCPFQEDLIHQVLKGIIEDNSFSDATKASFKMLANPEHLSEFLAQAFIHLVRHDIDEVNNIQLSEASKKKNKSTLKLCSLNEHNQLSNKLMITPVKFKSNKYLDADFKLLRKSIEEINKMELRNSKSEISNLLYKPVEISKYEEEVIRRVAKTLNMDLSNDFFYLGNLKLNPFNIGIFQSNLEGTFQEKEKYNSIKKLLELIETTLDWIKVENMFISYRMICLILKNNDSKTHHDVRVEIKLNKEKCVSLEDLCQLDKVRQEIAFKKLDIGKQFYISRSNEFLDYDESVMSNKPYSPKIHYSNYFMMSESDFDFCKEWEDVFAFHYFEENKTSIIQLDFEKINQNTNIAFPNPILVRDGLKEISYTIKSKESVDIVKGKIKV